MSFWHDSLVGECSLKTRIWDLFVIREQQDASIAQVWDGVDLHLTMRRCVDEQTLTRWFELVDLVRNFSSTSDLDMPDWTLEKSCLYSVNFLYKEINFGGASSDLKDFIWEIKVPPNIHVFL